MSKEYACVSYDNGLCKKFSEPGVKSYCVLGPCEHETPSNADRIRAMTDEELAEVLAIITKHDICLNPSVISCDECLFCNFCRKCAEGEELDWLQQPCGGADHE